MNTPATPSRPQGLGMTEYIAVAYQFFVQTIRSQTAGIAQKVSGQTASTAIGAAQTSANSASTEDTTKKGLNNYPNDNSR